jgi:hypothetical protein
MSRLGILPSIADPPGGPQPLQNWVDRARLASTGAHDLPPVQLEVGTIEKRLNTAKPPTVIRKLAIAANST